MSKLSLVLVVVTVSLTADVGAMKGGQILGKPFPYTVYILTGDREDVFYMRQYGQKYKIQEGAKTEGNLPLKVEEYRVKEENNTVSPADGGESTNLSNKAVATSGADKVPVKNVEAGVKEIKDGNVSPNVNVDDAGGPNSRSASARGKLIPAGRGENGSINNVKDDVLSPETKTEKSNEKSDPDHIYADVENGNNPQGKLAETEVNIDGFDDSKGLQGDKARSDTKHISSLTLPEFSPNRDGTSRDEKVHDSMAKERNAGTGNEISTAGGDSTTTSRDSTTTTRHSTATSEENGKPSNSWRLPKSHATLENFNDTKNPEPHCKLAASSTSTKPPRPQTLWRMCMGVIYDDSTLLTGDICFARPEGLHFFASVNVTNHDEAQEVTKIANGRNHFDFRVIRMNKNQTIPGEIPDWQDEETVYWNMEEMSNKSRTGIVPSFGYPPMVAALKLLPLTTCQKIYDELLEEYPAQTSTLPAFLLDTVVCATQADKPIDFPDGTGLVKPGLACPDSLGAPFVLDDGTVLGVLVAADCKVKNIAFFQTLGKGFPNVFEEEEEEMDR